MNCELQPSISLTHFWLEFTVHSSQLANCELFVREHQSLQFSIWNKKVMFFWKWRELCKLWTPTFNFLHSFLTGVHSSKNGLQFTVDTVHTMFTACKIQKFLDDHLKNWNLPKNWYWNMTLFLPKYARNFKLYCHQVFSHAALSLFVI